MRQVHVVPYQTDWPAQFEHERQCIIESLSDNITDIHHIGSTSVVGLAAKPVIDLLAVVRCLESLDREESALLDLSYVAYGAYGIEGRRFYAKGGDLRSHHLHCYEAGSAHIIRHLAFRAYLTADPELAEQYGRLKQAAAERCNNDINQYMAMKHDWIQAMESEALDWYARSHG